MLEKVIQSIGRLPLANRILGNAYSLQMTIYFFIGGVSALTNIAIFTTLYHFGMGVVPSAIMAYLLAALANYLMCLKWAFQEPSQWSKQIELLLYAFVVVLMTTLDAYMMTWLILWMPFAFLAKAVACGIGYFMNFFLRKYLVFR